ncbi:MAG: glycosyltransferase [Bacillota bacterium]|nr:glycosyltransferase [Bacillota bacterium]
MLQVLRRGKQLADYRGLVREELLEEIRALGRELTGVRVLELNAGLRGGVAEMLLSLVPLLRDVGVQADWGVLPGDEEFFQVTKSFHNALQGREYSLTARDRRIYLQTNRRLAKRLPSGYEVVIVHDPQPAAVRHLAGPRRARWIWRCHIDTSRPEPSVWEFLRPLIEEYDAAIFTLPSYVPSGLAGPALFFIPPAIDPLSAKNRPLPSEICRQLVGEFGLDPDRPFLLQVSRFDPWKDPLGVIRAYRQVKKQRPEVQLALVGSMAYDDPEAWGLYQEVRREAERDPDLYVLSNLEGVGTLEVNAFQRTCTVAIQKSLREGFGLTVSEALWKGKPVVAGRTGGIPAQVEDGVHGFLVESVEECSTRLLELLASPDEAAAMGARGHERVREHFLLPRLLRDELRAIKAVLTES